MLHSQIYKSTAMLLHHNACAIDKRGSDLGSCKLNFLVTTILLFWILLQSYFTHNKNYIVATSRIGDQMKCSTHIFQCARTECAWGRLLYKCWDRFVASFESPDLILHTSFYSLVTKIWVKLTKSLLSHSFRFKKELRKFDKYS